VYPILSHIIPLTRALEVLGPDLPLPCSAARPNHAELLWVQAASANAGLATLVIRLPEIADADLEALTSRPFRVWNRTSDDLQSCNTYVAVAGDTRDVLVHATMDCDDLDEAYPDDLQSSGLYVARVPAELTDTLAASCALGAFHRSVPIKRLWMFEFAVRDFKTGQELTPDDDADFDEIAQRCVGLRLIGHLGYSRRGFAMGFLRERMPDLLAAHEAAFAHFGGRCEFLLYDRMRTVVLGNSEGKPRLNPTFAAFASHWGFTPRLCQPYRAQTKGKVESGVKYVKRNFVPGRVFRDLEDFNDQLAAWQIEVADVREHGTTHQRPIDRFTDEALALAPTAGHPSFLQAMVRERVVADDWLVSIDGNRYSVPFMLIGKAVQVVRQGGAWVIRHRGAVVAEHAVLAGRAQLSVRPEHGPGAAARNARQRFARSAQSMAPDPAPVVEVRDLAVYEEIAA